MKRMLLSFFATALLLLNLAIGSPAQAQPLMAVSIFPGLKNADLTVEQQDLLKQLEAEILPTFQNILTPEQREEFTESLEAGKSFRKAFKSITLTPEEKTQIASLLKSLPKKDIFASLTPEQKKVLFMQKKEFFMPTPEEISEKISEGMKNKGTFMPEEISEKISEKIKMAKEKGAAIPTPEEISEKISAKMKALKDQMEE